MPELPEVELTRRRLEPELVGRRIERVEVRAPKLRLPIPTDLPEILVGQVFRSVGRRGKYLLFDCGTGWLIVHLGMTGFFRHMPQPLPPGKHDHLDIFLDDRSVVRLTDPRKFGTVAWTTTDPMAHPLLSGIGPEPLTVAFDGDYLFAVSRPRRIAVKLLIMDAALVAGVGNIYANEALFRAGIRPDRPASLLTHEECDRLATAVKAVLTESVEQGSTYRIAEGSLTYHPMEFHVYRRGAGTCTRCGGQLEEIRLGNRSTVFCPRCQS